MLDGGPIELDSLDLLLSTALIVVNGLISLTWRLQLERTLALAAVRTVVQLLLVGYVLEWVFALDRLEAVLPILAMMTVLAAHAAVGRTARGYRGMGAVALASVALTSAVVLLYAMVGVIGAERWWTPRYAIPLLGMILGNTLTGMSLGMDRFMDALVERRAEVETLLAHGATRGEAVRELRRAAARNGMIPILNTMMVVGVVSLPGMMTGQILAGQSPVSAVKYQVLIMFMVACATALGTMGVILGTERMLFDTHDRFLAERLRLKGRR